MQKNREGGRRRGSKGQQLTSEAKSIRLSTGCHLLSVGKLGVCCGRRVDDERASVPEVGKIGEELARVSNL
jgi:hypothetical protein